MSWESAATGGVSAAVALTLGVLTYRRSRRVDAISAQTGAADATRAGTAQIIEALNGLVDNLQEDNRGFRDDIRHCGTRLEALTNERDELRRELARLRRKYGDNGDAT